MVSTYVVTAERDGRTFALAFGTQNARVALSDDAGSLYAGHWRGLAAYVDQEVLLALSVAKARVERPLVRCAGCEAVYSRITFTALALADVRDRIEIRICECRTCVAAPEGGAT